MTTPLNDETGLRIAKALEKISDHLERLANPAPIDPGEAFRAAMESIRREMPVFGIALDQLNRQLGLPIEAGGKTDAA